MARDDVAAAANLSPGSGAFSIYLGKHRSAETGPSLPPRCCAPPSSACEKRGANSTPETPRRSLLGVLRLCAPLREPLAVSEGRCNTDNPMASPRKQRAYSATERRELWRRWREGESQSDIARSLGRKPGSVQGVLVATGGIEPPPRHRAPRALRLEEREEISRRLACGEGVRAIARALRRPPSTVSREVNRNGGPRHYRAAQADKRAWEQARRPKSCKLATPGRLRRIVAAKLAKNWSPEQISGWLRWKYSWWSSCSVTPGLLRSAWTHAQSGNGRARSGLRSYRRSSSALCVG